MRLSSEPLDLCITEQLDEAIHQGVSRLVDEKFASRLFGRDLSLWRDEDQSEAAIRLNWLDAPSYAMSAIERGETIRTALRSQGLDRFVLCGMGGSSLGPEMLARYFDVPLHILDSTDPVAIRDAMHDLERTALIVSSKSGTTVETRSQLAAFEAVFTAANLAPEPRIIVITDPESTLADYAVSRGYELVLADPHIGGRYSVLSAYGLVPAAIAGANLRGLVKEAQSVRALLSADSWANPALVLASASVQLASSLNFSSEMNSFGLADWVEQLVAESTGKSGVGILPVILPPRSMTSELSEGVQFTGNLGSLIFAWEVATAAMGWLLGVNPFDQPDVERSKIAARQLLDERTESPDAHKHADPPMLSVAEIIPAIRRSLVDGGYLAIQIFGVSEESTAHQLQRLARSALEVPVTIGWGPRFLHSTGQLHKGGPALGTFLQISIRREPNEDMEIPDQNFTFAQLMSAQAAGDAFVLAQMGQRVVRTQASLEELVEVFASQT